MSFFQRTSRAYIWGQTGRIAEAILVFGFSLVLARVLGPREYGVYALALAAAGLCEFVTLFGITPETFGKFVPEAFATGGRGAVRQLLWKLLGVRAASVAGAAAIVFLLLRWSWGAPRLSFLEGTIAWVMLVFAARAFYDLLWTYPGALLELRRVAVAKVVTGVAAPVTFIALMATGHSSVGTALLATAVGYLLGVLLLAAPWLDRGSGERFGEGVSNIRLGRIFKFGLFAWIVNLFILVLSDSADVLLVGWILRDPVPVGCYAIGARMVFRTVTLVLGWVPLIAVASIGEARLSGGAEKMAQVAEAQWKLTMVSIAAPLALLYCFAGSIVRTLFPPSYGPSVPVVRILCLLMIASAACGFFLNAGILYVLNRERLVSGIVGGAAIFNIFFEIQLVRRMGINGAAWATGCSYLLLSIVMAGASARFVPLRIPWQFNLKVLGAAAFASALSAWVAADSLARLAAACGLWAAAFLAGLVLLKPLAVADSLHLGKISPRLGVLARRAFVQEPAGAASGQFTW